MEVREGPEGVLVLAPWRRPRHVAGTLLTLLFLSALAALSIRVHSALGPVPVLLLNVFTPVPLCLLYVGAAGLLNRTVVRCSRREGRIGAEVTPLPWRGRLSMAVGEVEEFVAVRRARLGGLLVDHGVDILLAGGGHLPLLPRLADAGDAAEVVRVLSAHVGLGRAEEFSD